MFKKRKRKDVLELFEHNDYLPYCQMCQFVQPGNAVVENDWTYVTYIEYIYNNVTKKLRQMCNIDKYEC
jgi:hypothetical protein